MTTTAIRRKLMDYIRDAESDKVKAIYTLVEHDFQEENDIWSEDFVKEMERRKNEFEEGRVKGITWEEVQKRAIRQLNAVKGK